MKVNLINQSRMFNKELSTIKEDHTSHLKMKSQKFNNLRNKADNKCQTNRGNNTKTSKADQRRCLKENSLWR